MYIHECIQMYLFAILEATMYLHLAIISRKMTKIILLHFWFEKSYIPIIFFVRLLGTLGSGLVLQVPKGHLFSVYGNKKWRSIFTVMGVQPLGGG